MKRIILLILAAGIAAGPSINASAIDFKVKGQWVMSFDYGQNGNFTGGNGRTGYNTKEDEFEAKERVRLQIDAVASESLSGTVYFEIGNSVWGQGKTGGAVGADQTIVEVRRAYIDWMIPETPLKVRMGIQGFAIPAFAMKKSQAFVDDVAGIAISGQFNENVGLTAFWLRPLNDNHTADGSATYKDHANYMDNIDAFGVTVPLTFDGIKVTPWGMIAGIGPSAIDKAYGDDLNNVERKSYLTRGLLPAWGVVGSDGRMWDEVKNDEYATAWWAGVTMDITYWDPFRFALDFTGGGVSWDNNRLNRAGWMVAAVAEYKFDWGTPGLIGWYASGDDDDLGNGSERLPFLSIGNGNNDFSNYALDGGKWIAREGTIGNTLAGTWGLGLRVKDFSFLDDLKHTFRINYYGGTNNHDILKSLRKAGKNFTPNSSGVGREALYLTDLDSALEIGLFSEYKLYSNFKIALDATYIALFLDDSRDTWKGSRMNGASRDARDAWNVNVSFVYDF